MIKVIILTNIKTWTLIMITENNFVSQAPELGDLKDTIATTWFHQLVNEWQAWDHTTWCNLSHVSNELWTALHLHWYYGWCFQPGCHRIKISVQTNTRIAASSHPLCAQRMLRLQRIIFTGMIHEMPRLQKKNSKTLNCCKWWPTWAKMATQVKQWTNTFIMFSS